LATTKFTTANGVTTAATYYPMYDGNGNITSYIDSNRNVVAAFNYDSFGGFIAAAVNPLSLPYAFSTKPLDSVTGLYYYAYRWYDPLTGRWPSRDPIGEEGGVNLYGFVGNDGTNEWDYLGLEATIVRKEDDVKTGVPFDPSALGGTRAFGNIIFRVQVEGKECWVRLDRVEWWIEVRYLDAKALLRKGKSADLKKLDDLLKTFPTPGEWAQQGLLITEASLRAHELEHLRQYESVATKALAAVVQASLKDESPFNTPEKANKWKAIVDKSRTPLTKEFQAEIAKAFPKHKGAEDLQPGEWEANEAEVAALRNEAISGNTHSNTSRP
jgi:RHS repeat-associated protein